MSLTSAVDALALVVAAGGLVAATAAYAATRRPGVAMAVLLDLLLAAGLLRLSGEPTWQRLVTAAVIVTLRRVVTGSLHHGATALAARDAHAGTTG